MADVPPLTQGAEPNPSPAASGLPGLSFEKDVRPLLKAQCFTCHGGGAEVKAHLDLRLRRLIAKGGDSGPAIAPGDRDASLLYEKVASGAMPPGDKKLAANEIALLGEWIAAGAPNLRDEPEGIESEQEITLEDREFWSFQPLSSPPIPAPSCADNLSPIDAFLLAELQKVGLDFSPEADRLTLLRRAAFDLTGLPPTPAEMDAFSSDESPDAYERMLDRWLASPAFGERWGRHWLDVAGYVDTVGFDIDLPNVILGEGKWRYRDYVIDAFNRDKPFDRMLIEQLAGDELIDWRTASVFTPEIRELLIATGYLRTAEDDTHEPESNIPSVHYAILHDTMEIVGSGLLGLTIQCARCHSHKFDPIPQTDYYRLMAALTPAYNSLDWKPSFPYNPKLGDRAIADVSPTEKKTIDDSNAQLDLTIAQFETEIAKNRARAIASLTDGRLATLPEAIRGDVEAALESPAENRDAVAKYLADKFASLAKFSDEETQNALDESEKTAIASLREKIADLAGRRRKYGKIQALVDVGPPPITRLLTRGNHETPGEEVTPGFLRVLTGSEGAASDARSRGPQGQTSGRRLALAHWLVDRESPAAALVARVMVNRVWMHLFGEGIVPSLDNFGKGGEPPSHPALLEWLANDFVRDGWRIKGLIKKLMMSRAYRQTAIWRPTLRPTQGASPSPETIDPENRLLWRARLRRLEAEVVRDSILAASGQLDRTLRGPPIAQQANPDGMVTPVVEEGVGPRGANRRSVYMVARRKYPLSILRVFDEPVLATNCLRRDRSAVPLQSLAMLNDRFLMEQSRLLAELAIHSVSESGAGRADSLSSDDRTLRRIEMIFRRVLSRNPSIEESNWSVDHLRRQAELFRASAKSGEEAELEALATLAHVLFNTSEFLYSEGAAP